MSWAEAGPVRLQPGPVLLCSSNTERQQQQQRTDMSKNAQKALSWALTNADVDGIVELLTTSAADIDVDERDRACGMQTALMRLCHLRISESHRCHVLRLLLHQEPDVNVRDGSGRTVLAHACIAERADVVEYLSQVPHCDPAAKDNDGNTPLMHAVRTRRSNFVHTLLRCFYDRLDVNAKNNKGATALTEAENRQDTDICRVLVTEGGAIPFPSNPMPASARQTPMSSISDLRLVNSPLNIPSRASSTPRRRLETLPPAALPFRPRGPVPDDVLSPRSARPPIGLPSSLLASDNLSDTSSTVLLSLPEEGGRSPGMPRKNARKKESASEFGGGKTASRGKHGSVNAHKKSNAHLPDIVDAKQEHLSNGVRKSQVVDEQLSTRMETKDEEDSAVVPSRESSPVSLPKLADDASVKTDDKTEKPAGRRRVRKNSASLPNLTNTGPTFLVSPHRGYSTSISSDNIAGSAAAATAAAAAAESRALDWERGVRSSYRKETTDFKLPQLNVALNGNLTTTEWCTRCGRTAGLCGCGIGGGVADVESRVESSRLSSKGRNRNSGNGIERMLYLSGDSRIPVRPSRTFTSGD